MSCMHICMYILRRASVNECETLPASAVEKVASVKDVAANHDVIANRDKRHFQDQEIGDSQALERIA